MRNRRFTEEEIAHYSNDPNIRIIRADRLSFSLPFRQKMYDELYPGFTNASIRKYITAAGYGDLIRGTRICNDIKRKFDKRRPVNGKRSSTSKMYHHDKADDAILLESGRFERTCHGIRFTEEFVNELYHSYPEQSVEDGIRAAGIDPELVGYQRIYILEKIFSGNDQSYEREFYNSDVIEKYSTHPYVKTVTSKKFTLKKCFYNEACHLTDMKIDDILDLYLIDYTDLSVRKRNRIFYKLRHWKPTEDTQDDCSETALTIRMNRMRALQSLFEKVISEDGKAFKDMTCPERKEFCIFLKELMPDPDRYYTTTRLLTLAGIPRTTFYQILRNDSYGTHAIEKDEQDIKDIEIINTVIAYKGFKKGIRQIYMDMEDITGIRFGINKIRRLMRKAGIETPVRKPNSSRKSARELLKRNLKPNVLKRTFRLHEPNEVRLTDVTYLDYGNGKRAYASACKDPVTNRLIDFTVSECNDLSLVLQTVEHVKEDELNDRMIFHSDQGTLYLTDTFQNRIRELGFTQSMSKRGNCWDNAPQESFFGHFKDECDYRNCDSLDELKEICQTYMDYYNHERRQWNLNRMTPVQYEHFLLEMTDDEKAERMRIEQRKYDEMKIRAAEEAAARFKTLGV